MPSSYLYLPAPEHLQPSRFPRPHELIGNGDMTDNSESTGVGYRRENGTSNLYEWFISPLGEIPTNQDLTISAGVLASLESSSGYDPDSALTPGAMRFWGQILSGETVIGFAELNIGASGYIPFYPPDAGGPARWFEGSITLPAGSVNALKWADIDRFRFDIGGSATGLPDGLSYVINAYEMWGSISWGGGWQVGEELILV